MSSSVEKIVSTGFPFIFSPCILQEWLLVENIDLASVDLVETTDQSLGHIYIYSWVSKATKRPWFMWLFFSA